MISELESQSESGAQAKQIVKILEQVFTTPSQNQDHLLSMMLRNANDGFLFLNILTNMVPELARIPIEYIEHCLKRTKNNLELSADKLKVRLRRTITPSTVQSDRFGNEGYKDEANKCASQAPDEQSGHYYVPYAPRFQHSGYHEDQEDHKPENNASTKPFKLKPVLYHNGNFVVDDQVVTKNHNLSGDMVPDYTRQTHKAIGESPKEIQVNQCFNCNSTDHSLQQCPEPRNEAVIRANRKEYMQNGQGAAFTSSTRFFIDLGLREAVSVLQPGKLSQTLQEALDLEGSEPPYYRNMRAYGYPPGYLEYQGEDVEANLDNEAPLAIYNGETNSHTEDKLNNEHSTPASKLQTNKLEEELKLIQKRKYLPKFQSVTYPGLSFYTYDDPSIPDDHNNYSSAWHYPHWSTESTNDTNATYAYPSADSSLQGHSGQQEASNDEEEDMDMSD